MDWFFLILFIIMMWPVTWSIMEKLAHLHRRQDALHELVDSMIPLVLNCALLTRGGGTAAARDERSAPGCR